MAFLRIHPFARACCTHRQTQGNQQGTVVFNEWFRLFIGASLARRVTALFTRG